MSEPIQPESFEQLADVVQSHDRILPVGHRTKPALCKSPEVACVSMSKLSGIIQYEPSEFTFTAWAGTPVSEVRDQLAEKRQYLPFDPLLADRGATLGGTVAAAASGPGRVRYGGVRDFLLGVRLLTGEGDVINAGGKVVKNAAGFDIPKLLVGSLGRLGVMTQLTFKVFPQAADLCTVRIRCKNHHEAIKRIATAAASRWELDAIDYQAASRELYVRVGGPTPSNQAIVEEIAATFTPDVQSLTVDEAKEFWKSIVNLEWPGPTESEVLVKIPVTPSRFLALATSTDGFDRIHLHLSGAASVVWATTDLTSLPTLQTKLAQLNLEGLVVRGDVPSVRLGKREESRIAAAVKIAMDTSRKFPAD